MYTGSLVICAIPGRADCLNHRKQYVRCLEPRGVDGSQMKRSAFLTPCHPPKFEFLGALLRSHRQFFDDTDVFVVFTSEADRDQFRVQFPDLDPRYFIHGARCTNANIVTTKKFKGLNDVFALGYEFVGVIDAENASSAGDCNVHCLGRTE